MHRYIPHTPEDIAAMLERCGMQTTAELYSDVPESLLHKGEYDLPGGMSETEIRRFFDALNERNAKLTCFAGGGFYHHYSPAAVNAVVSRSEFLTAYTPYQPEISQGTLQYIFEYQSMMSDLTGLPVSNASMYDGTTATAEAMIMSTAASRKRSRVAVSRSVREATLRVLHTYARYHGVDLVEVAETEDGVTDRFALSLLISSGELAGVIVPSVNRHGIIEDFTELADECHAKKTLLIVNADASSLAVLRTPGEWGADIACGDAQSLGLPLNYGGPYLGYICASKALMRKMPGRIVGATTDDSGQRVFVLTLQAREQHIRRDKATSNICSNQGLMALYVTVYMSLMGANGLREVACAGHSGAAYLSSALERTGKMKRRYPASPVLNEFEMITEEPAAELIARCASEGILAGIATGEHSILIAVTEMQTKADMDRYAEVVAQYSSNN